MNKCLFGKTEVYILDQDREYHRIGYISTSLEPTTSFESKKVCSVLRGSIRLDKKAVISLKRYLGLLKSPRTTYKSIRRECAKRNRNR